MKALKYLNSAEDKSEKRVQVKPVDTPWGAPLVQRIQKPLCGCLKRFDPITKKEVQNCGAPCPSLLYLCRHTILRSIPLTSLDTVLNRLPLPQALCRAVCKLQLNDFFINPFKVQKEDVLTDCYTAVISFSGLEIQLQLLHGGARGKDFYKRHEYMASFVDQGVLCIVWDPVISLQDLLRATANVGHHLSHNFVWQVIEEVSKYITDHCKTYEWHLNSSVVKLTKNKCIIFIDVDDIFSKSSRTSLTKNHAPEILTRGRFSPERAYVWALGSLIYEMVTLMPLVYDSFVRQSTTLPSIHNPQPRASSLDRACSRHPMTKKKPDPVMPTRDAFSRLVTDTPLRKLMQECLTEDPLCRPTIKNVLKLAQKEVKKFPMSHNYTMF